MGLHQSLVIVINLFALCHLWQFNNPYRKAQLEKGDFSQQRQLWFSQLIDHFDYQQELTWNQRYYVFDDYFEPRLGPAILYIGGQGQCRGISNTSWTAHLAQQTKGIVLSLEHRFYGQSLPFGNESFTLSNLKYLNSEQALKDLAYFITKITKDHSFGISSTTKWITVGGSYPGALSAWFRSKYPHLTVGAIASSAVVLAVQNFWAFDEQMYISTKKSGSYCSQAIIDVTQYVEYQVTSSHAQQFQAQFNAQKLNARQFLFYWSDVIVFQIQYGHRRQFCDQLKDKTIEEVFKIIKQLVLKVSPADYGSYYLKNSSYASIIGLGARQWYYQSCTQFSYFQTYSKLHPMRSTMLTLNFYRTWCQDIFGYQIWPYVDRVNNLFGGLTLQTNHLIMTNGVQDPWKWAGLQKSKGNIIAEVIDCDDCAHCVQLRSPNKKDAKALKNARQLQLSAIQSWLA